MSSECSESVASGSDAERRDPPDLPLTRRSLSTSREHPSAASLVQSDTRSPARWRRVRAPFPGAQMTVVLDTNAGLTNRCRVPHVALHVAPSRGRPEPPSNGQDRLPARAEDRADACRPIEGVRLATAEAGIRYKDRTDVLYVTLAEGHGGRRRVHPLEMPVRAGRLVPQEPREGRRARARREFRQRQRLHRQEGARRPSS